MRDACAGPAQFAHKLDGLAGIDDVIIARHHEMQRKGRDPGQVAHDAIHAPRSQKERSRHLAQRQFVGAQELDPLRLRRKQMRIVKRDVEVASAVADHR